jgi:hypothetical protein
MLNFRHHVPQAFRHICPILPQFAFVFLGRNCDARATFSYRKNYSQSQERCMRNFNTQFPDDPRALHNEPLGNGSGLESFHTTLPEDIEPNKTPKIVGTLAVALMIGVAGTALYMSSGSSTQPKSMVAASNLPAPSPPALTAATPNTTPDVNTAASAPAASAESTPVPVAPANAASVPMKKHVTARASNDSAASGKGNVASSAGSAASARMAADSSQVNNQPQQQAAIPEPVSPTPSPSDQANNSMQSGAAAPENATTASDVPAVPAPTTAQNNTVAPQQSQSPTPQASNTAPAQGQQTGATPAPAQPPTQSAGQVSQ